MMDDQAARFAVLLEDVDRKLGVMAEAIAVQDARWKRLESKFDGLESRMGEITVEIRELNRTVSQLVIKVDKLEGFAADAGPRLVRIEDQLSLNKPLPRRDATRAEPSKHHRRKPAKRT
jgi:septal ring factor EnvC (AmiA/AmiB activator)